MARKSAQAEGARLPKSNRFIKTDDFNNIDIHSLSRRQRLAAKKLKKTGK